MTMLYAPMWVIDPDDQEQMERFASLHDVAWQRVRDRNPDRVGTPTWEITAEQFRLFKDPNYRAPIPEPDFLGTTVQTADGDVWARNAEGRWLNLDGGSSYIAWADMDVIRILVWGVDASKLPDRDRDRSPATRDLPETSED